MEISHQFSWPSSLHESFGPHARHERRDASEHRRRILEVARQLFAEHGVDATSMHQIAMAAGIGQGTLYRRYAHKGQLCVDLLREQNERLMEEITLLFTDKAASSPLERLDSLLSCCITFLEEQGPLLEPIASIEMRELHCHEPANSRRFRFQDIPYYLRFQEMFSILLTQAVERGELPPLDIPFTVDAILATLNPMLYRFHRQERGYSSERILQGLRRIYIDGTKTPHN